MEESRELARGLARRLRRPKDSRFFVPKKNPVMGFTINFGHRYWALVLLALIAVGLGIAFFALVASL